MPPVFEFFYSTVVVYPGVRSPLKIPKKKELALVDSLRHCGIAEEMGLVGNYSSVWLVVDQILTLYWWCSLLCRTTTTWNNILGANMIGLFIRYQLTWVFGGVLTITDEQLLIILVFECFFVVKGEMGVKLTLKKNYFNDELTIVETGEPAVPL